MPPRYFVPNFESVGLSVQEKNYKIHFQDGGRGGHLGFLIETILAIFHLKLALILPTKFRVNWPFGSGEVRNGFKDGGHGDHLGFSIGTIFTVFDLQIGPILPSTFRVNWPFGSGEEIQIY